MSKTVVSIPSWVFAPSRPAGRSLRAVASAWFQSRPGFSLRRDRGCKYGDRHDKRFSGTEIRTVLRGGGLYSPLIRVDEHPGSDHVRLLVWWVVTDICRCVLAGTTESIDPNSVAIARVDM